MAVTIAGDTSHLRRQRWVRTTFFGKIGKTRDIFRKMVKIYGSDNCGVAKLPFPQRSLKKTRKEL